MGSRLALAAQSVLSRHLPRKARRCLACPDSLPRNAYSWLRASSHCRLRQLALVSKRLSAVGASPLQPTVSLRSRTAITRSEFRFGRGLQSEAERALFSTCFAPRSSQEM